jgi:cytochrome c oxidase subunit 2
MNEPSGIYGFFHKSLGLPVLASEHGVEVDKLIVFVHYLMLALFVGWVFYFIFVLFRFRKSANPNADYHGVKNHASSYLEVIVAGIEGWLLLMFAIPGWGHQVDDFPSADKHPVTINVVAQQFNWNVFYPGTNGVFGRQDPGLVTDQNPWGKDLSDPNTKNDLNPIPNIIHVPINREVVIMLSSKDVIHSLKVIALRVTQDAIPGVKIPIHFIANKPGVYQINCAQLCGNGHAGMAGGRLYVDTQEEYDKWYAAQKKWGAAAAVFE